MIIVKQYNLDSNGVYNIGILFFPGVGLAYSKQTYSLLSWCLIKVWVLLYSCDNVDTKV